MTSMSGFVSACGWGRGGRIGWRLLATALVLLFAALLAAGCVDGEAEKRKAGSLVENESVMDVGIVGERPQGGKPYVLGMADWAPVIETVGPAGALPSALRISFLWNLFEEREAFPLDKMKLDITPPIEGSFSSQALDTLLFSPAEPFKPQTTYTVRLVSFETTQGVLQNDSPTLFTTRFTTPGLTLLGLSLVPIKGNPLSLNDYEIGVRFSLPVAENRLREALWVRVGERRVTIESLSLGSDGREARLRMGHIVTRDKPVLTVSVQAPILSKADSNVVLRSGEAHLTLPSFEPAELVLLKASAKEGANGHYIDIVCNDKSLAEKGERWYWDPEAEDSYPLSKRCMPSEESLRKRLHLTPETTVTLAPGPYGFRLLGAFKRGTYTLTIDPGLLSEDGGESRYTFAKTITIGPRKPKLTMVAQGRYLPRSAWDSLLVRHTNIKRATLSIRRIPEANLAFWLSDESEEATPRNSDLLAERPLTFIGKPDRPVLSRLRLADYLREPEKGVIVVSLGGKNFGDKRSLVLTDINLITKHEVGDRLSVWAFDMHTLRPLAGVTVSAIVQSGRELARAVTTSEGYARLDVNTTKGPDTSPAFALIARKGSDLTYLRFRDLAVPTGDELVSGAPYPTPYDAEYAALACKRNRAEGDANGEEQVPEDGAAPPATPACKPARSSYRAMFYTDRGVYRPGDVAHLVALVRENDARAVPKDLPIVLTVTDPRGRPFVRRVEKSNEVGMIAVDLPFAAFADTGKYQIQAEVGALPVAQGAILVEEFVPERMRAQLAFAKPVYVAGDAVSLGVSAAYLFGGSAEGSPVELSCSLTPEAVSFADFGSFRFGPLAEETRRASRLDLGRATATLDKDGRAILSCPESEGKAESSRAQRLLVEGSVSESGSGRGTHIEAVTRLHPERFYIGLACASRRVARGETAHITGVLVDTSGRLWTENSTIDVEVGSIAWDYLSTMDESTGHWNYTRLPRYAKDSTKTVEAVGGRFRLDIPNTTTNGDLFVRVKAKKAMSELVVASEYDYWRDFEYEGDSGWNRSDLTPKPEAPLPVQMETPDEISVNHPFTVRFNAPFKGRALLSLESYKILESRWVEVNEGANSHTFTLSHFVPNIYGSILLIKDPHGEDAESFLPGRAFGIKSVRVAPEFATLPLVIKAPKVVKQGETLEINLALGGECGPAFVSVAAVDEGILSLTRFQTPEPLRDLFARHALGVGTFETVGWNLLLPRGDAREGGDGGSSGATRVQPIKPVALFSGLVPVKGGKATVRFLVPPYQGELRLMAVAASATRIGSAEGRVTVRNPLVVQTTLPRFLTQHDVATVPVFVSNQSGRKADLAVRLTVESLALPGQETTLKREAPLVVENGNRRTLALAAGASGRVLFTLKALKPYGAARVKVTVEGEGESSEESLDLPLAPPGTQETKNELIEIKGEKADLLAATRGFFAGSDQTSLLVGPTPFGLAFTHLRSLLHYPYGCVEQTTSAAWPLLYLGNLLDKTPAVWRNGKTREELVESAIVRLATMQTPQGGFAMWPGGREPVLWGSAYATHFLIAARELGFSVAKERIDDALRYLEAAYDHVDAYPGWRWHSSSNAQIHYVLALGKRANQAGILAELKAQETLLAKLAAQSANYETGSVKENIYILKAALYLSGDRRFESDLKRLDTTAIGTERESDYTYYSDLRRAALTLFVFTRLFGADAAGMTSARAIAQRLAQYGSSSYTTQEMSWSVAALGAYIGKGVGSIGTLALKADGRNVEPLGFKEGEPSRTFAVPYASLLTSLELTRKGGQGSAWALIATRGVPTKSAAAIERGLSVTQTLLNADGRPVTGALELGQLVYVELKIRNTTKVALSNLYIDYRFPAGLELENARLGRGSLPDWVEADSLFTPDYMDARDMGVSYFGSLMRDRVKTIVFAMRAVVSGRFQAGGVNAGAMYAPEIEARSPGGLITINAPWSAP